MTRTKILTPWLCTFLLSFAACDKDESLGEVETESESAGESQSGSGTGDTEGTSESQTSTSGATESDTDPVACPADAMICPDGSAVGRSGPNCEFDPCPGDPPMSCDEGLVPAEPASCPNNNGTPVLEGAGCYLPCENEFEPCEGGDVCTLVQTNPCPCPQDAEVCCGSCTGDTLLCLSPIEDTACAAVVGQTFHSVDELECGLTPDGVSLCNWTIAFDDLGGWVWMYSDVGDSGEYTCEDGTIRTAPQEIDASYSPATGILLWDGVEYTAEKM